MNGGELAKEFRSSAPANQIFDWCHKAQSMLRQQQAEIKALKGRELTDEEIAEIYHSENRFSPKGNFAYYGFARAILRKAQEK